MEDNGEDGVLLHLPHVEADLELGGEDEPSDCVVGFLFTTPPIAGPVRARKKSVTLTMVIESLTEVLRTFPRLSLQG